MERSRWRPSRGSSWVPAPRGDLANLEAIIKTLPAQIAQAKRNGACVIIDTAPVGEVSEALRIASVCDQVVVVARPRHTDRRRLRVAPRSAGAGAHAPTVGMVLVAEDASMVSGDYGYGYSTGLGSMLEDNGVAEADVQAASSEKVRGIEPG